jgi:hypothetical protein
MQPQPHGPTGPRTEAGKARSAQNATKHGLFTSHDFIRPGEQEEYAQALNALMHELTPDGTLEETFAKEILGATWRLRRCRMVEEAFSSIEDLDFDPMMDERTEKQQRSVDRARAQSHYILRRSIAELTKLQTERQLRNKIFPDAPPADRPETPEPVRRYTREELKAIAKADVDAIMAERALSSLCKPGETMPPSLQPATSFCKPEQQTPRNALCPCGSGNKFKRCCGTNAPPVLNRAA